MKSLIGAAICFATAATQVLANDVSEFCADNAVGTVAELRSQHYTNMSEREISIARQSAITACMNMNAGEVAKGDNAGKQTVAEGTATTTAGKENEGGATATAGQEKDESWWSGLLDEGNKKEARSPIEKMHRTGGK